MAIEHHKDFCEIKKVSEKESNTFSIITSPYIISMSKQDQNQMQKQNYISIFSDIISNIKPYAAYNDSAERSQHFSFFFRSGETTWCEKGGHGSQFSPSQLFNELDTRRRRWDEQVQSNQQVQANYQ
jgi:hypothetical protein